MATFVRELNLELGRPSVDEAMRRLDYELAAAGMLRTKVFKLIHGYGSSGTGGKIRTACRKQLQLYKEQGRIADFIPGENFTIFDASTRHAFTLCAALRDDRDLERENRGVTFVVTK